MMPVCHRFSAIADAATQIPSLRDATRTGRLCQRLGGYLRVVCVKTDGKPFDLGDEVN
jgi:hypothetical protein